MRRLMPLWRSVRAGAMKTRAVLFENWRMPVHSILVIERFPLSASLAHAGPRYVTGVSGVSDASGFLSLFLSLARSPFVNGVRGYRTGGLGNRDSKTTDTTDMTDV